MKVKIALNDDCYVEIDGENMEIADYFDQENPEENEIHRTTLDNILNATYIHDAEEMVELSFINSVDGYDELSLAFKTEQGREQFFHQLVSYRGGFIFRREDRNCRTEEVMENRMIFSVIGLAFWGAVGGLAFWLLPVWGWAPIVILCAYLIVRSFMKSFRAIIHPVPVTEVKNVSLRAGYEVYE